MATKIQVRRGNATAIPPLDVAEPGWDVDTKTYRVGDGTSTPARIPTTKSTGSFSFPSVTDFQIPRIVLGLGQVSAVSAYFHPSDPDTGLYSPGTHQVAVTTGGVNRMVWSDTGAALTGNLSMSAGGTVDTVDISLLNPSGVNGIMVKTGTNAYGFRNLVPGNGIGAMLNGSGQANAGGATGDIVIAIANNPTIPGIGAMRVPVGTTGDRTAVAAVDGHFRYNSTTKSFEGRIDGEWRSLVDYVEGKTILVPSQLPSIQDAINYYANRSARSLVGIRLESGVHTVTSALSPGSITTRIDISGTAPVEVPLQSTNPVSSVSGSPGNWLITYRLAGSVPTGITTNHSIIIRDIVATGDHNFYWNWRSDWLGSIKNVNSNRQVEFGIGITNVADIWTAGDYIQMSPNGRKPEFRQVTSIINSKTIEVNTGFSGHDGGTYNTHRRLRRLTGTLTANNSTTITGTGTSFQNEVNLGDILYLYNAGQYAKVTAIASNTSLTIQQAVTCTGDIALQHANPDTHQGCWKISSIDTIANTVTVVNTCRSTLPPIRNGFRSGSIVFCPSTILFTSTRLLNVDANEYVRLTNVTARYTGSTPTLVNFAVSVAEGGAFVAGGHFGLNGAGILISSNSTLSYNSLSISNCNDVYNYAMNIGGSTVASGTWLTVSGNVNGAGIGGTGILSSKFGTFAGNGGTNLSVNGGNYSGTYTRSSNSINGHGASVGDNGTYTTRVMDFYNNTGHGLNAGRQSLIMAAWGNSLIAGNYAANINLANGSTLSLRQASLVCSATHGLSASQGEVAGTAWIVQNNLGYPVYLTQCSMLTLSNDSRLVSTVSYAIFAQLNTFVFIANSFLKGISSKEDVRASSGTNIYLYKCTGFTKTSPALNGAVGNVGSMISSSY